MKVYIVIASKGSYDDYREFIVSVHKSEDGAKDAAENFDKLHLITDDQLPMTEKEWIELNYGLDESKAAQGIESFVDRGGFTAEQFKIMGELIDIRWEDYHPCRIEEFDIQD